MSRKSVSGIGYFAIVVTTLHKNMQKAREIQRKLDREAEKHETAIARTNNALLLQDIAIEREKLRIERERLENERLELDNLKKKKNLGLTSETFEPIAYE